jgi:4-hydroxythreonine-4-phosphate dehydrogenase
MSPEGKGGSLPALKKMVSRKKESKPIIAITMGDPRGIGPEVVLKALARGSLYRRCVPLILGDAGILSAWIRRLRLKMTLGEVSTGIPKSQPGVLSVLSLSHLAPTVNPGHISAGKGARASFAYIERAAEMALRGEVDAVATGPVHKEAITAAGIPFQGHTEYLAKISGKREFVMMLTGRYLKVALVTTHLPLRDVPRALDEDRILSVVEITGEGLKRYFGLRRPRMAVAGLNPHAGEGGLFGEEEKMIARAVRRAKRKGFLASGPWPPDSIFYRARNGEFDVVVSMYHDQGLIPLKLLHFDEAVNVTLGLPFVRTSVDHGVAMDIAGKGVANSRSMEEAIRLAAIMAGKAHG